MPSRGGRAVAGLLWISVCFRCGGIFLCFFFQAEDGIRDAQESRGLGDVYKRQNPASMEAGEYGLTRGACFVACRLEVVARSPGCCGFRCVFDAAGFFCVFFFRIFFFERTRPAASMRAPCLICLSTSTGVRTGCHYLISLSVCMCV